MNVGTPEALQVARMIAVQKWRYLGTAFHTLIPIETTDIPHPMGVDKYWRLVYNPNMMKDWTPKQMAGVLYHEVLHLLRNHHARTDNSGADRELANVAQDLEINDNIITEKGELPDGCNIWDHPQIAAMGLDRELLWEQYYKLLNEKLPNPPQPSPMGGSCGDGQQRAWESGPPKGSGGEDGSGESDVPGVSPGRGEMVKRKVAEDVKEAMSRDPGKVPGHLQVWSGDLLEPKVPWRHELSASIRHAIRFKAGLVDYSYHRPSRRQAAYGDVIAPTMRQPIPSIAVIIDTSGSMHGLIEQAMAEVSGVLNACGATDIRVLGVDADVSTDQHGIRSATQVNLGGGGGTDMTVGITYLLEHKPLPDICIILTDGFTGWRVDQPPFKVIVGMLDTGYSEKPPSWMKTIQIMEGRE